MAPPKYRVQCCSFNGHLTVDFNAPDLTSWLIPTLEEGGHEYSGEDPPDFVAIGFQEMIPLHLSLSGLTKTALDLHDYKLKEAVERYAAVTGASEKKGRETYTLMAKKVLGGIALLVYTRDRTVTSRVVDVRVATAACGMFKVMGNKGGVGVRIVLDDEEDDEDDKYAPDEKDDTGNSVFTFVTAHLAAHDHGLKRRNEDYQSIVERLIFSSDGPSQHYQPRKPRNIFSSLKDVTLNAGGIQIYDTSYLFFFGDLNYRISTKTPKPLALHLISHKMINDLPALLVQDQLTQEQALGLTLHHLREGTITFKPTYKYKPGTISEFKKFTKRVPGWCDRVLFATWADGEDGAGTITKKKRRDDSEREEKVSKRKGAKVELYRSFMTLTQSDHKPVTSIIACPRHPKGSHALRLPFPTPFLIDPLWRRKQLIGMLIDRFIGFFWCIIMLAGFGKDARIGIATLGGAAMASFYYRTMLGM